MGSRGRSIRLRIYFLVAIPLITMLGLFSYVAYSSVTNWLNLDRAPNLINATSEPLTNFVNLLQTERRAAVVYLSQPDAANLNAYQSAITTTKNGAVQLAAALSSSGTTSSSTAQETAAIAKMTAQINGMTPLRTEVAARQMSPLDALAAYTNVIAGQGAVLQAEASSIMDAAPALQGFGLISAVDTQEDLSEQDAVLASALVSGSLTAADRVAFSQAAGRQQDDTLLYQELFTPAELKTYDATMNAMAPAAMQNDLTMVQQAVPAGVSLRAMEAQGLSPAAWQTLTSTWLKAASTAGTETASAVLTANSTPAVDAKRRVWETAGVGAAGLILTLLVTILLGRSINRRLTRLRRSALSLAEEQLPAVVARLRHGESVDVAAEAPPIREGTDEIGQVGQAIDMVRQTAIRSAVEEARLRAGIHDVFRNLARRNQSLLQRQLTVLDGMERRATDPDVLDDLFKMDHLTTRMRRHAEGLIILSGAPPGRGWSAPVKLIDVMRGAVAEVEDYARVTVSTQSRAALAGSAVTDVIHLLAELIENATTLSPPFTQVKVSGDIVGNGFVIEIEDRGLGMTPEKMAELNERLANPPDINPANTEQLGLFVVGQLARRHGIAVTLRPSAYGGTTAVTLIPQRLIVDEGPAAITAGGSGSAALAEGAAAGAPMAGVNGGAHGGPNGFASSYRHGSAGSAGLNGSGGPFGSAAASYGPDQPYGAAEAYRPADPFGSAESYGPARSNGSGGSYGSAGSYGANGGYAGNGSGAYPEASFTGFADPVPPTSPAPAAPVPPPPAAGTRQAGPDAYGGTGPSGAPGGAETGGASSSGRRGRHGAAEHGAAEVPVVTGVPVSRPGSSSFDVFTPLHRTGAGDEAAPGGPADAPYAESYTDYGGGSYGTAAYGDADYENIAGNGDDLGDLGSDDNGSDDYKGLPRRVRQANLAPQLRSSAAAGATGSAGVPRASAASLTDMRNTLSAMQRGWQQGRSQSQQQDTEGEADGA